MSIPRTVDKSTNKYTLLEFPADIDLREIVADQACSLVKRVVDRGNNAVLYGVSTAGKSFLGLDLAWCLALGKPWHGLKVKRAPVLYVCLEGIKGFRKRVATMAKVHGDPGKWMARLILPVSLARDRPGNEAGSEGTATILRAADELAAACGESVGLIIIDTYAQAVAGDNENEGDDVMHYVRERVQVIAAAAGAAMLTIAHPNRSGDLRGSLHLRHSADVILRAERNDKGTERKLIAEKVKDDAEGELFNFALEVVHLGTDPDGDAVTSCVVSAIEPKPETVGANDNKYQRELRKAYHVVRLGADRDVLPLADVRKEFLASYPSDGEADPKKAQEAATRAWRHVLGKLPEGLERCEASGVEYLRKADGSLTNAVDEFEALDGQYWDFG